jgi:hypothetical protein
VLRRPAAKLHPLDGPGELDVVFTYGATILSKLSGLPIEHSAELVNAVHKRKPALKWLPSLAAPAALGWMFIFGRVTDVLEGTRWDVLAFLDKQGPLGIAGILGLGFGIAIALGFVAGFAVPRAILRRLIRHHLYSPACFWCGYSLVALEAHEAAIRCPECGKYSPVSRLPQ